MILKEDITIEQTTREVGNRPLLAASLSSSQRGLPSTASDESVPWYRPPSFPPPARISTADPAPWRVGPPPRYRVKRRPLRFFPLAFSVTWAAMLLGTTVNFIIESIILMATTHIRAGLFSVFRLILTPAYVLIASSAMCIVLYPIHHAIPPAGRSQGSFRNATFRYKVLRSTKMAIPLLVLLVQLLGAIWFLVIAFMKAGEDVNPRDDLIKLGNGHVLKFDPKFPKEADIWNPWFMKDDNVKLVTAAAFLSAFSSILYFLNSLDSTYVYRIFTGDAPPRVARLEKRFVSWWTKRMNRGYAPAEEGDEAEGEMMIEPRRTRTGRPAPDQEYSEEAAEVGQAGVGASRSRTGLGLGLLTERLLRRTRGGAGTTVTI